MRKQLSVLASAIAGLALAGLVASAQASPIDVSYTVSGSAGNWLIDFSVTDNLGGTNNVYLFGVQLSGRNIAGSPSGWDPNAYSSYNSGIYGGAGIEYDNIWITNPSGSSVVTPGQTSSGFQAVDTSSSAPQSVSWFAWSAGSGYTGPGCSMNCGAPFTNPGFEGVAAPVPEPASGWLIGTGLLGLGQLRRKPTV